MCRGWSVTLQRARIEQLASAGFMDQAYNLILVGGTGTGKTHLATALAIAAIHQGKRVRFYNAVDLVNQLDKEKQQPCVSVECMSLLMTSLCISPSIT